MRPLARFERYYVAFFAPNIVDPYEKWLFAWDPIPTVSTTLINAGFQYVVFFFQYVMQKTRMTKTVAHHAVHCQMWKNAALIDSCFW
ncbi:hypothetical protein COOONC_05658 [Cooperia oncophora]